MTAKNLNLAIDSAYEKFRADVNLEQGSAPIPFRALYNAFMTYLSDGTPCSVVRASKLFQRHLYRSVGAGSVVIYYVNESAASKISSKA